MSLPKARSIVWLVAVALVVASLACSSEAPTEPRSATREAKDREKSAADGAASEPDPESTGISNQDLDRGIETELSEEPLDAENPADLPSSPSPRNERSKRSAAPRAEVQPDPAAEEQRSRDLQSAEQKVTDLEKRIADLEKAVLATKNPLLPREWTRLASDDENAPVGDLAYREEQLRQAREELLAANGELARLRDEGQP